MIGGRGVLCNRKTYAKSIHFKYRTIRYKFCIYKKRICSICVLVYNVRMEEGNKMFKLEENNKQIGQYLSKLIDGKYKSRRQFCIAYIKADGNRDADNDAIQKMSNRISQIIQGKKAIQIYDLPIFTMLLDVSCEEILSAGKCFLPVSTHLTNYSVAFTKDRDVWENYVHREDKLILNCDEYGKTILDYALEFKNLEFLKYLMEKKYVWFVDMDIDPKDYFMKYGGISFGAGTNIKRRSFHETDKILWHISCPQNGEERIIRHEMDVLPYKLAGNDDFRKKMISLAIEYDEIELLVQLRAREIPFLYSVCHCRYIVNIEYFNKCYDENMIAYIAEANEQILDYFSAEYEIKDYFSGVNKFVFPFLSDVLNLMVKNRSPYLEKILKRSIEHNRQSCNQLKKRLANVIESRLEEAKNSIYGLQDTYIEHMKSTITENVWNQIDFYEHANIFIFNGIAERNGTVINLVHVNEQSNDKNICSLIQELNDLYDSICRIKSSWKEL